jgi:hypothetical protein
MGALEAKATDKPSQVLTINSFPTKNCTHWARKCLSPFKKKKLKTKN